MIKTILLVDDDPDAREMYGDTLTAAGFRVITAVHGAEGVAMARKYEPQLILMDLRMPLMGGRSALAYLRSDSATRHIPVWAISAYLEVKEGALAGREFDRLIPKPIMPYDLVRAVTDFLGMPDGSGAAV